MKNVVVMDLKIEAIKAIWIGDEHDKSYDRVCFLVATLMGDVHHHSASCLAWISVTCEK
jgi:hypothetical protein